MTKLLQYPLSCNSFNFFGTSSKFHCQSFRESACTLPDTVLISVSSMSKPTILVLPLISELCGVGRGREREGGGRRKRRDRERWSKQAKTEKKSEMMRQNKRCQLKSL